MSGWKIASFAAGVLLLLACSGPGRPRQNVEPPLRVRDLLGEGDAARRASLRLVLRGLDADAQGLADRAEAEYSRALQVDPTNPYAYLALARQRVDGTDPMQALPLLDQAESLLHARGEVSRAFVHIDGLRGEAYYRAGRTHHGLELLERARRRAPGIWGDGQLSAEELQ